MCGLAIFRRSVTAIFAGLLAFACFFPAHGQGIAQRSNLPPRLENSSFYWRVLKNRPDSIAFVDQSQEGADVSLTCHKGTGEVLVQVAVPSLRPLSNGLYSDARALLVGAAFSSGPIVRYYTLVGTETVSSNDITYAEARPQISDPLWVEFARSGSLYIAQANYSAINGKDLSTVRFFLKSCGRQYPLTQKSSVELYSPSTNGVSVWAHPFSLAIVSILFIGGFIALVVAIRGGIGNLSTFMVCGCVIITIYATLDFARFNSFPNCGSVVWFYEAIVPIASVAGELIIPWIFISAVLGLTGLTAKRLIARSNKAGLPSTK